MSSRKHNIVCHCGMSLLP